MYGGVEIVSLKGALDVVIHHEQRVIVYYVIDINEYVRVVLASSVCMLFETTQHYNILNQITYHDVDVNMKTNIFKFAWFLNPTLLKLKWT